MKTMLAALLMAWAVAASADQIFRNSNGDTLSLSDKGDCQVPQDVLESVGVPDEEMANLRAARLTFEGVTQKACYLEVENEGEVYVLTVTEDGGIVSPVPKSKFREERI